MLWCTSYRWVNWAQRGELTFPRSLIYIGLLMLILSSAYSSYKEYWPATRERCLTRLLMKAESLCWLRLRSLDFLKCWHFKKKLKQKKFKIRLTAFKNCKKRCLSSLRICIYLAWCKWSIIFLWIGIIIYNICLILITILFLSKTDLIAPMLFCTSRPSSCTTVTQEIEVPWWLLRTWFYVEVTYMTRPHGTKSNLQNP